MWWRGWELEKRRWRWSGQIGMARCPGWGCQLILSWQLSSPGMRPIRTVLHVAWQTLEDCGVNLPGELMALRQLIHDSLGEGRHTSEGNLGRQTRVSVKTPLSCALFDAHFRSLDLAGIPQGQGNVSCYVTGDDLTKVLGPGWSSRAYSTSTVTYVNFHELIHLQWGYKARFTYSHENCDR